ncbi:MAG: phosphonate C-P lyase system protein PhnH [Ignavibacteriota bacterium]
MALPGYGLCLGEEPVRGYCLAVLDALLAAGPDPEIARFIEHHRQLLVERDRREFNPGAADSGGLQTHGAGMSTIREIAYDEVFDGQKHFRSILDSMSRPGKINPLDPVKLAPPPPLNPATVLAGWALMDRDVTFHTVFDRAVNDYLAANTGAAFAPLPEAGFIFAPGTATPEILEFMNCGSLLYPDTGATLVLQIEPPPHSRSQADCGSRSKVPV